MRPSRARAAWLCSVRLAAPRIFSRLTGSAFLKNVATMMTGTVIAQAIPMLLSPVMTRLYAPKDYGLYAAFMVASTTISAFASGRYEFAVVLPEKDHDAVNVVGLCLVLAVAVAAAVGLFAAAGGASALDRLGGGRLGAWVYLVPPMVLLQSAFQTLNYWLIRLQAFRVLSIARVARAIVMGVANLSFGVLHVRGGLILSSALGQAVTTLVLVGYVLWRSDRRLSGFDSRLMREVGKRYRSFAIFALPADLLSTLAGQFPILLLDEASSGLYAFVQLVVNAPLSVISGSVLDAFKDRAARDRREKGNFAEIFDKIAKTLAALGLVPLVLLLAVGPLLFRIVFGAAWEPAGHFARILAAMYFLKLVVSPLSYSYYIVEKQAEDFVLHVGVLVLTGAALWLGMHRFGDATTAVTLYAGAYSFVYAVYFVRSRGFSRGRGVAPLDASKAEP